VSGTIEQAREMSTRTETIHNKDYIAENKEKKSLSSSRGKA
jgi:hypothetical protein